MARRKRQWLEDDDSSSNASDVDEQGGQFNDENDPLAREERDLFNNPYKKKQRREGGDDALYGIFAETEEDEASTRPSRTGKKHDLKKPVAFVSGETTTLDVTNELDVDSSESDDNDARSASPSSPLPDPEAFEKVPSSGGIGSSKPTAQHFAPPPVSSSSALPASDSFTTSPPFRGGIGSSHGGIGASSSLPSSFGSPSTGSAPTRTHRSFLRDGGGGASVGKQTPALSAEEQKHFSKLSGSYGARLMAKMGWQAGEGIGLTNPGIVTPIEAKLRPKAMGIAFKGFREKTEQSKVEAKRRGEHVSEDDEPSTRKSKGKGKALTTEDRSEAWKKSKKSKTRVKHMTYEQILEEAQDPAPISALGQIIDATGATPREVSSLADVSNASWIPSADPERLPEVRHNLRILAENAKADVEGLAREAKTLEQRKKWVQAEDVRLRRIVSAEAQTMVRLQKINAIVEEISSTAKQIANVYEVSFDPLAPHFELLAGQYRSEYDRYRLDEVVVGAIAPLARRSLARWEPLIDPMGLTVELRRWKSLLKMTSIKEPSTALVGTYSVASPTVAIHEHESEMTPYESLLWNLWLPRIRSAINNEWAPSNPSPLIHIFEAWSTLIPRFIYDNVLDQLILPKIHKAVTDWTRTDAIPLHTLILPWLPHVGLRMETLVDDARRKVKSLMRGWKVEEGVPHELLVWREVFGRQNWEDLLLKYVVPKLGACLRDDLKINPRSQDMQPLTLVLVWADILHASVMSQLLEMEFFPKWLDILHLWLVQPNPNFDEVTQWYSFWKQTFSEQVLALPGVSNGFTSGLQLMNRAIELGPDARTHLPKLGSSLSSTTDKPEVKTHAHRPTAIQVTFRNVVEDYAAGHNLLFVPTGKVHDGSRMPLFKVAQSVDGRGGLLVYLLDDAVWAPSVGDPVDYRAISMEEMVLRAAKGKR